MSSSNYGHLVKPLPVRKGPGKANAQELVWMMGNELEGFELNFAWGVYNGVGNWHEWAPNQSNGAHTHPYDEVLVFVGHDTSDLTKLGAVMEISLGKELEKHSFDKATAVVVPKGMVHCPLIAKQVDRPYSHYHMALGSEYKTDWLKLPEEKTDGKKYEHLMKPLPMKKGPGGANADQIAWLQGKDLEGLNLNFTWGLYSGLGDWEPGRDPHVHPYDEVLVFVGHNTDDLSYLGAEIEFALGKEQEKHVINKATAVVVPRGLIHCPVVTKKVEKPFSFFLISLSPKPQYEWLGPNAKSGLKTF